MSGGRFGWHPQLNPQVGGTSHRVRRLETGKKAAVEASAVDRASFAPNRPERVGSQMTGVRGIYSAAPANPCRRSRAVGMGMFAKAFRLFVSSTFQDFGEERRLLQEQVFPRSNGIHGDKATGLAGVNLSFQMSSFCCGRRPAPHSQFGGFFLRSRFLQSAQSTDIPVPANSGLLKTLPRWQRQQVAALRANPQRARNFPPGR